jgi:hypothetical protein
MPITIRKLPRKNRWRVRDGERIVAKSTTKTNAERQARLLRGISHGMKPRKSK